MSLAPGARLGSYEVVSLLGAGGMGQVYRARDSKLGRDVALKVLPELFALDPERLARFKREGQVLAALNHPNIAVIHDVHDEGGVRFLVLELLEGETLAARLKRGALPVDEALDACRQVAEALEAAHGKGVLHRDLKPGNIQMAADGRMTVMDFGLATVAQSDAASAELSPTISLGYTGQGVVLGTAAYMSPEQARGRAVDRRADVWAFGCVLFEALTAEPAFKGETVTDIVASVMKSEPDWSRLPPDTPAAARSLMRQCLQKQPKSRLHDIADARVAIEDAIKEPASASRPGTDRRARRSWQHAAAIGAFLIPAAAAAGWFASRVSSPPGAITHLEMSVQPADQLGNREFTSVRPSRTAIAVSPDGGVVVFSGSTNTSGGAAVVQLYTRRSGEANATPIQGTEGGRGPFFSPDGEWIGFWAANRILKVPAAGGPAVKVCDLPAGPPGLFGASWGDDGFIYFSYPVSEQEAGISRVADGGGKPTTVTRRALAKGEVHVLPHILPGGRGLLFTSRTTGDWQKAQVVLHVTDAGAQHVILDGAADARYVGPGHLVYMQLGTLMAVPFDLSTLTLTGDVVALIEGVMQAVNEPNSQGETGAGQFAVSSSGTLLYADGGTHPNSVFRMVWVDRDGGEQPVLSMRARIDRFISPRLSPDGSKIAVLQPGTTTRSLEVWIYDTERAGGQRLSSAGLQNWPVVWSPDGSRVAHGTDESGVLNIAVRDAAGVTQAMRVTKSERTQWPSSWAKGGNLLAFVQSGPANPQIWVGSMDGGSLKPQPFLDDPRFSFTHPDLSPDGKWVAYASNESGEQAVWVRPYPGPGGRFRISTENGVSPIWTSGGREILYRQTMPDGAKYYSVTVRSFSPFQRGDPRLLFQVKGQPPPYVDTGPVRGWDATADGKRFLLVRGEESRDKPVTHFHVILNWVEELKRRVPTR